MHFRRECHERDGNQHGAGNWADPWNRAQDAGSCSKAFVDHNDLFDLGLQLGNLVIQQAFQLSIHGLKCIGRSELPLRLDLREEALSGLNERPAPGHQSPEKAYLFMWKGPPCIWPEDHEPRDERRVDPVGLGPCTPVRRKGVRHCARTNGTSIAHSVLAAIGASRPL